MTAYFRARARLRRLGLVVWLVVVVLGWLFGSTSGAGADPVCPSGMSPFHLAEFSADDCVGHGPGVYSAGTGPLTLLSDTDPGGWSALSDVLPGAEGFYASSDTIDTSTLGADVIVVAPQDSIGASSSWSGADGLGSWTPAGVTFTAGWDPPATTEAPTTTEATTTTEAPTTTEATTTTVLPATTVDGGAPPTLTPEQESATASALLGVGIVAALALVPVMLGFQWIRSAVQA